MPSTSDYLLAVGSLAVVAALLAVGLRCLATGAAASLIPARIRVPGMPEPSAAGPSKASLAYGGAVNSPPPPAGRTLGGSPSRAVAPAVAEFDAATEYLTSARPARSVSDSVLPSRPIPHLPETEPVHAWLRAPSLERDAVAEVDLTVVVPAFNEEARLPEMLDEAFTYLSTSSPQKTYEILVVDDGSRDATVATALAWSRRVHAPLAVVRHPRNAGKGAAVRSGMLRARGSRVLFADADGATRFADLAKLEAALPLGATEAVVVGSRAHLVTSEAVVKRSKLRNLLMYGFHWVLWLLAGPLRAIGDTQCGFKLLTRSAARRVVPGLHVRGWIFDIELLLRARWAGMPIAEVAVSWHEVSGSKVNLVQDSVRMLRDLVWLRIMYACGVWA
ncbi:dolichyl-phosphate beta-glucosyltransferase [Blastocladiella emersonii ATCC 22665]|nr:dolichyl-phosphate beta-glucosyltransferase [Blastocladiella emersonii ATCC 22665]